MPDNTKNSTHLIHLEARSKTGSRIFSPTAARNSAPIAAVLKDYLPDNAQILEIGSGTGEHGLAMCRQRADIIWMPSDPDAESRASIADRARETNGQMHAPLNIDVTQPKWWDMAPACTAIYCANMIHIAPPEALIGLAKGASKLLQSGGVFALYGPFLDGENTAPSNLAFHERLKVKNSAWGVRELDFVKTKFAESGLAFTGKVAMPANNLTLMFMKG